MEKKLSYKTLKGNGRQGKFFNFLSPISTTLHSIYYLFFFFVVCAKLAVSETWKDDGDFDPQTINTVGKIVLDGVVNNFCEARFEFKKNSLRKAMQEVVRKETLLLVNQKDVGPLMLAANSGNFIIALNKTIY